MASTRTLKRRSSEMEEVRELISKGSSKEQLQSEITALNKTERQSLLDSVLATNARVAIPAEDILAMKADLSITWSKLRVLRR